MPSPYIVKIKVQPYIKKYLIAKSENKAEPVFFGHLDPYGGLIVDLISNYNYHTYFSIQERENINTWFNRHWPKGHWLEIRLPYNRKKNVRCHNYFSINRQQEFVMQVKRDFYKELYFYLVNNLSDNVQRKDIILAFLNFYDISEDDVKFESIYRQTSRMLEAQSPKYYKLFNHQIM